MGKAIFTRIHPDNPELRKIQHAVEVLRNGGIIIYPTDTVYGMGCDLYHAKAFDQLCKIKGVKPGKDRFSLIFYDISQVSEYVKPITTQIYRVMKKGLPGPFTFILQFSNKIPRSLETKRKTVGVRIPDNLIPRLIARELGNPMVTASIRDEDAVLEYSTDPSLIFEKYEGMVDLVIDGGYGKNVASTIVDCTGDEFEVLREGLGDFESLLR